MKLDRRVTLERIIEHLEHVRTRPGLYIAGRKPGAAQTFLWGFSMGLRATGFADWGEADVEAERGYACEKTGVIPQMERRGMDEQAILNELFEMEIEGFRRALAKLP